MLEIDGLRVSYRDVIAVHGVSFRILPGETLGVVGPNGAGKTSIVRAICGLIKPDSGRVVVRDEDVTGMAPESIVRRGVALVPEGRHIFKTLTVAENLMLAKNANADWDVEAILARFPVLRDRYRKQADGLSGGEAQQLAIARALLLKPRLLILDEPSFGLAPKMIDSVYALLGELREKGLTMLLVEQVADRTIAFSDRTLVLASGRQRAMGSRAELERDTSLHDAYLGAELSRASIPLKTKERR